MLALMLAGFLALSPIKQTPPGTQGKRLHRSSNRPTGLGASQIVPVASARVLILDLPFEPSYAYIRVDNTVYALPLHGLKATSLI
jgi:hypothetical protein